MSHDIARPEPGRWRLVALVMGAFLLFAGVSHFTNPDFFNDIVPPWLWPSESFWTYLSGVAEIAIALLLFAPVTRRAGATAAIVLFIAVYPANLYMTWDWRDRPASEQLVSWGRLPLQFVMIWLAWRVVRAHSDSRPVAPGDIA